MKAELLEAGDSRWTAFLESVRHDFYHLPDYVALSAQHEGGEPVAVLVTDGPRALLQPIIVRPIPGGGYDATTPYGYPGPLVRPGGDAGSLAAGLATAADHLAGLGMVSLFIRLHPLLNPDPPSGLGSLHLEGVTVSIDLTLSPDEQWRQVRGNHRTHINRALKAGRTVRFDDAWLHGGDFERVYQATMARVQAPDWYFFDGSHFAGLREALGKRLRLAVVEVGDRVVVAGLFVETCGIVQYHLSGSDPAFTREGLTKLMIDHVRRWGTDRGDELLHLGGGVGGADDPLLHFKSGFSERRHRYYTLRLVLNPAAYDGLVASRGVGALPGAYFPTYRALRRPPPAESDSAIQPHPDSGTTGRSAGAATPELRVKEVDKDDVDALAELLPAIDSTFFRPHAMTLAHARRIASQGGRDVYLIGYAGGEAVAYGMLRGWDEGYPVASLGIGVRRDRQQLGYGRAMMRALHERARKERSGVVRLRVHPDNRRARALYDSLGYRPAGTERGELLMLLDLDDAVS